MRLKAGASGRVAAGTSSAASRCRILPSDCLSHHVDFSMLTFFVWLFFIENSAATLNTILSLFGIGIKERTIDVGHFYTKENVKAFPNDL